MCLCVCVFSGFTKAASSQPVGEQEVNRGLRLSRGYTLMRRVRESG